MIRVRAFGTVAIEAGRLTVRPEAELLFGILLYLTCNAGESVSRARLIDLFWSGGSESQARHSLRQLLYRLRRAGAAITLEGDDVSVRVVDVDSDFARLTGESWPERAPAAEINAAALLLVGFALGAATPFRDWLDQLRSRIAAQHRRAVMHQLDSAKTECRWSDLELWADRALAADPMNEEATCARAEAMQLTGSKLRALGVLDNFSLELGALEPVLGLPARILRKRISEAVTPRPGRSVTENIFVGRSREASCLNALVSGCGGRGPSAAVVAGVAGIGKSTLVQRVCDGAQLRGWRTVEARLRATDAARPLAAFIDLFTRMLQMHGALGCSPASLAQLKTLTQHDMPDLRPLSREAEAIQLRLRAAALDLLGAVSEDAPIIVVMEDLHWADEATLGLLAFLVDGARKNRVAWLLTARPEGRFPQLKPALPHELAVSVSLGPLTVEESEQLFDSVVGSARRERSIPPDARSIALSGGNPLFIGEFARHCIENGWDRRIPASLRSLMADRVARLPRSTQMVLQCCAVLGGFASVGRLSGVLGTTTYDLLSALEELTSLGLLSEARENRTLSIHDLWQDELLLTLSSGGKQLLHLRCGEELEVEAKASRSTSLTWETARHFQAAGERGRALALLMENAEHLLANGLALDAAKTFGIAVEAATEDEERRLALEGQARALHRAAKFEELAALFQHTNPLRAKASREARHSVFELVQAEVLQFTQKDPRQALEIALACVRDQSADTPHRLQMGLVGARVAANLASWADLRTVFETVSALLPPDLESRVALLAVTSIYNTECASIPVAVESALEWVRVERASGSVRGLMRALRLSTNTLRVAGESEQAVSLLRESFAIAEEQHFVLDACFAADGLASTLIEMGLFDEAEEWLERAESYASDIDASYPKISLITQRAIVALARGQQHEAARLIERDLTKLSLEPAVRVRNFQLATLSRLLLLEGRTHDLEPVLRMLAEGLEPTAGALRNDYFVASLARGLAALGRDDEGQERLTRFLRLERRDVSAPSPELLALVHR